MSELNRQSVLAALAHVRDGNEGADVISQGRIQGVSITDGHVRFAIAVSAQEGAAKEPLRIACEDAVRAVPGVTDVSAVLTAERAAHSEGPGGPRRPSQLGGERPKPADNLKNIRAIIAVASGKGGVGKSTTAVNLALGLSRLGLQVGLLDTDIYGPSIPRMMGISGMPKSNGKKITPHENYGIKCMSIGFLVDESTAMIWEMREEGSEPHTHAVGRQA